MPVFVRAYPGLKVEVSSGKSWTATFKDTGILLGQMRLHRIEFERIKYEDRISKISVVHNRIKEL